MTVNLNLASIWSVLLKKACDILKKDIEAISGNKIKTHFHFSVEHSNQGKIIGFETGYTEFGCIIIESEDPENDQCVIIKIGTFNPCKINDFTNCAGHTEKAAVFFQKTSMEIDLSSKVLTEALWVNLEAFPSQEFCKRCEKWLFSEIHPVRLV